MCKCCQNVLYRGCKTNKQTTTHPAEGPGLRRAVGEAAWTPLDRSDVVGRAGATRPVVKVGRITGCEAVCVCLLAKRLFLSAWFSLWRLDDPVCVEMAAGKPSLTRLYASKIHLCGSVFCFLHNLASSDCRGYRFDVIGVLAEGLSVCHLDHIVRAHWHLGAGVNYGHPRNLTTTSCRRLINLKMIDTVKLWAEVLLKVLHGVFAHAVMSESLMAAKWLHEMC